MNWADLTLYAWIFLLSEWAIRLVMLVIVPFRRTPAAAKGWLLLIMFEPWIGLLIYWLIGRAQLRGAQREQLARLPQAMAAVVARLRLDRACPAAADRGGAALFAAQRPARRSLRQSALASQDRRCAGPRIDSPLSRPTEEVHK